MQEQGFAKRFVAGFAVIGLLLAVIIGVWTWQSTSQEGSPRKATSAADSTMERSVSISTRTTASSSPKAEEDRVDPVNPTTRGSEPSTSVVNIAPLGEDPYLPPNTWDGTQSGLLSPAIPTSTVIADAIGEGSQSAAPGTSLTQTTSAGTSTSEPNEPASGMARPSDNPGTSSGANPGLPDITHLLPALPGAGVTPPKGSSANGPTDTTADSHRR
ncbi:MAG TPA: hypothetical protein H9867_03165 [Candidatus Corynebacterium gallistercoris]|uniref:Uncharacterized protein n=1 Tax=Candidatus Corynebacterium gallistercoris TaxID=2838530 RepID=A0A9D1UQY1_9CORY|nr:hypothetical protein [Candidatus Corynebacterium gallistercoris]